MTKKTKIEDKIKVERKLSHVSSYTITMENYDDGTSIMTRRNDGFVTLELIGLLEFAKDEILLQLRGNIKPDFIKREVVID